MIFNFVYVYLCMYIPCLNESDVGNNFAIPAKYRNKKHMISRFYGKPKIKNS